MCAMVNGEKMEEEGNKGNREKEGRMLSYGWIGTKNEMKRKETEEQRKNRKEHLVSGGPIRRVRR